MVKKVYQRKRFTKEEYLPYKLIKRLQDDIFIDSGFEYRSKNNFLQCVSIIHFHQLTNGIGINDYVPLGRNYWKKVFGGNYHENVIQPLLNKEIIESFDFGYRTIPDSAIQTLQGKQSGLVGIRYRINPDLLDTQYEIISYFGESKVLTSTERTLFGNQEFIPAGIADMNYHVTIDPAKACTWIENNAERICNDFLNTDYVQSLPEKLLIEYHEYLQNESYNIKFLTVEAARKFADSRNKKLFYFKDTFYIADISEFLKKRVPALIYNYKNHISLIYSQPIIEKRNPITLRLYSNLANFPSKILQFIKINNKTTVQLDLRTSQFLIFANLLNVYVKDGRDKLLSLFKLERNKTYLKRLIGILNQYEIQLPKVAVDINDINSCQYSSSDVTKFVRDIFFYDFYTVVQTELGLKDRILAKQLLFKMLFKKTNRPDALLIKLTQRYPVVMTIIATFKKQNLKLNEFEGQEDNHESNFSVFLQCIEGELFVDNILQELRANNIPCFTRHDSVVVASGYEEQAEVIAKKVFRHFGFKYNHKIDDKFWESIDYGELEDSTFMQWMIDEDILNTDFYFGEVEEDNELTKNEIVMDEQHLETLERLKEIGIRDEYYGIVDAEFLEEISLLPFLTKNQQNILYDDINNLHDGLSFLQDNTNELLRHLIKG